MTDHKAWNWSKNNSEIWNTPSEDSYYLLHRWKENGFKTFLDLGCGLGRHSYQFEKYGFKTFSYDLSSEAIKSIKEKAANEKLNIIADTGDMIKLPYSDTFFDCLLAYHVISHTDTEGMIRIIKEIRRVLKNGGEFYLTLCSKNAWSFKSAGYPIIDRNTVKKIEDGPENEIPHFFADDEIIKDIFAGFKIHTQKHIQDQIVSSKKYESWHYFILGCKE